MSDERDATPLEVIEHAVQARAKQLALDMAAPDADARLRALIDDEIRRWNADAAEGVRPYELPDTALVAERAWRNLAGYGPLGPLLDDDDVWEIQINAPDPTLR